MAYRSRANYRYPRTYTRSRSRAPSGRPNNVRRRSTTIRVGNVTITTNTPNNNRSRRVNATRVLATAAQASAGMGEIAKKLLMSLALDQAGSMFSQRSSNLANQTLAGGSSMQVHPTIVAMRLVGQAFAYSSDDIAIANFTLGGQSYGRRVLERLKSVLTLGQQVPEYLEGLGLDDNAAELVEALLVDFDAMLADGTILVPEPRRGGETRSALFEQLNFLHFNLQNGNAWLTDNPYSSAGRSRRRR